MNLRGDFSNQKRGVDVCAIFNIDHRFYINDVFLLMILAYATTLSTPFSG